MSATLIAEPPRIARLKHDRHGRPVPWFVAWIDGEPDFRVLRPGATGIAWTARICWLCGLIFQRQEPRAYLVGPMCVVNRISAEPPSHAECASYAVQVCPFLTTPNMVRRDRHLPEGTVDPPGKMIRRNPGVIALWVAHYNRTTIRRDSDGSLFDIGGAPLWVEWWSKGRPATRAEVAASVESGLPLLAEECQGDEAALFALDTAHAEALRYFPKS